jgi:hypothetical protein
LLQIKGSKQFWQEVMKLEISSLSQKLNSAGKDMSVRCTAGLNINTAWKHFETIAKPPLEPNFDNAFYEMVRKIVDVSLMDTSNDNIGKADDINELRANVHQLLEDDQLASRISREGRKTAIRLWGKEHIKKSWQGFFEVL